MIRNRRPVLRAFARVAVAAGLATAGVLVFAAPASAHVTVNPREATQGGFARLAFRVPTESDTTSTTKIEVVLPENAPVASVSTMPVPGWTVAVERRKLAQPIEAHGTQINEVVSKLTWTATPAAAIKPGQFQEFPVSMGPLPEVDTMVFKALQTYSDGTVVRWIEEPADGAAEPEHPAPVLKLVPATAPGGTGTGASASPAPAAAGSTPASGNDSVPLWLGITGLVAGLLGLILGGLALARARGGSGPASSPPADDRVRAESTSEPVT